MIEKNSEYEASEGVDIGTAHEVILGEKPLTMVDTVSGDLLHRPEQFADCEE